MISPAAPMGGVVAGAWAPADADIVGVPFVPPKAALGHPVHTPITPDWLHIATPVAVPPGHAQITWLCVLHALLAPEVDASSPPQAIAVQAASHAT